MAWVSGPGQTWQAQEDGDSGTFTISINFKLCSVGQCQVAACVVEQEMNIRKDYSFAITDS